MDQVNVVYGGPFKESPQGSSAESDNAQARQRVSDWSRDTRRQHNERGREIVTNVSDSRRADHYSAAAIFESESPPHRDDGQMRRTRQSESTSANPRRSPAAAPTIPYSHSAINAEMNGSSTTTNSQRQNASTSQHDKYTLRKLTNSDPHSFVSTQQPHNGFHGVDIGALAGQAEGAIQRSFQQMGTLQQMQYDLFLKGMNERAGILEDLERHLQLYMNAFHQVKHEKERMVHERNLLQGEVKDLQNKVARLQQQVQVQNHKPIVPVNTYSTHTADGASGADVIGVVQQLNEEIFQFAALLADEYERSLEERSKVKWDETVQDSMRYMFCDAIVGFVRQAMEKGEHAWIEHALQTCIIECCMGHLTTLTPYRGSSIEEAYRAMRCAEDQGVSGQWRSLAYRYGSKRITERPKVVREKIQSMCQILGWRSESQHGEALQSIVSKTVSLHKMIFTEILSGDIEIIFPQPDTPFDPETMEIDDNRKEYKKPTTGEPIVCTTDVGLIKSVIKKRHSDGEWKFHEDKTVILKAKVALRNSLPDGPNERAEVSSRGHVARGFGHPFSQ